MYQVELEILYFMLPSLLKNGQNSLQGSFRRVQTQFCPMGFEGTLTFTPSRLKYSIVNITFISPYDKGTLYYYERG